MRLSHLKWYVLAALAVFGPVGARMLWWERARPQPVDPEMAKSGEELFNHAWQVNDPLTPGGDGLGPVFNGRSCVACHNQGGPGGGGDVEHNVTTFVITPKDGKGESREGVIHSHATEEKYRETLAQLDPTLPAITPTSRDLAVVPVQIQMDRIPANVAQMPVGAVAAQLPAHIQLSQRNTPALFGVNLIDSIPERVILAEERSQRFKLGSGTVGRVHRLPDGRIGRFGWKGQTASLAEFVEAACANELGLGNPNREQPTSLTAPDYRPRGRDLTQQQCDQLTAFVASLDRPVERLPADTSLNKQAHDGRTVFNEIGCANCHVPTLGSVEGIYSDLLLHRMGDSLGGAGRGYNAPPVLAKPDPTKSDAVPPDSDEWRTPPLWGVADSAPYLHDGRAATLEEAIQMHGGQAERSAVNFRTLDAGRRNALLAFMRTLRAR